MPSIRMLSAQIEIKPNILWRPSRTHDSHPMTSPSALLLLRFIQMCPAKNVVEPSISRQPNPQPYPRSAQLAVFVLHAGVAFHHASDDVSLPPSIPLHLQLDGFCRAVSDKLWHVATLSGYLPQRRTFRIPISDSQESCHIWTMLWALSSAGTSPGPASRPSIRSSVTRRGNISPPLPTAATAFLSGSFGPAQEEDGRAGRSNRHDLIASG